MWRAADPAHDRISAIAREAWAHGLVALSRTQRLARRWYTVKSRLICTERQWCELLKSSTSYHIYSKMITIPSLGNLALISGSPSSQTSEMPTKSGNRNGSVRVFFIPEIVWKNFLNFKRWADLSWYYLISELDSKALCTKNLQYYPLRWTLTSSASIFVLNVCYIIFISVSSICPTAFDLNLLVFALTSWIICFSLCVLSFLKRRSVTASFGNCSANGKFRSFMGVQSWCQITFVNEKLE